MQVSSDGRKKVGNAVKAARLVGNLTQTELANVTGLRQATIADIENGKANATIETLIQIAKGLNCDLEVILKPKE